MEEGGKEVATERAVVEQDVEPIPWSGGWRAGRGLAGAHVPNTLVAPVPQLDKGSKEQG